MPLLTVVMVLIVVGSLLWAVNRFIPMEPNIKSILNAVVIIAVILWILALYLPINNISTIRVGHP